MEDKLANGHAHEEEPLINNSGRHCCVEMGEVVFSVGSPQVQMKARRVSLKRKSVVLGAIITDACNNGRHHEVIELPDVHPKHFENFLRYVDEDSDLSTQSFSVEEVAEVLQIAKRYSATVLQLQCRRYLENALCTNNAISIYQCAQKLNELKLEMTTYGFIIKRFPEILQSNDFLNLDIQNLHHFLQLDEICANEIDLFRGVFRWAEAECQRQMLEINPSNMRSVLQSMLSLIRFPLISLSDFSAYVAPSELLTCEEIDAVMPYLLIDNDKNCETFKKAPFNIRRRGISPPKTYSVCFFDCVIYDSEVWIGKWKYNLIKVNRPIAIVSFGFDGPIRDDATYYVKIKLTVHESEDRENINPLPLKDEIIHAKRERPFHVKFETPALLKPDVFYRACYSLQGPKTIWGVRPKSQVQMFCDDAGNVVFTYGFVDGQMPEIRFTIPS